MSSEDSATSFVRASRPLMRKTAEAPATSNRSLAPRCAISMSRLSRAFPSGMLAAGHGRIVLGPPSSFVSEGVSEWLSSRTRASNCGSRVSFAIRIVYE